MQTLEFGDVQESPVLQAKRAPGTVPPLEGGAAGAAGGAHAEYEDGEDPMHVEEDKVETQTSTGWRPDPARALEFSDEDYTYTCSDEDDVETSSANGAVDAVGVAACDKVPVMEALEAVFDVGAGEQLASCLRLQHLGLLARTARPLRHRLSLCGAAHICGRRRCSRRTSELAA